MPQIRMELWLTDATTEMKLIKPEDLKELFPEFAQNEREMLEYRALAEHFLDTLDMMNKLIK